MINSIKVSAENCKIFLLDNVAWFLLWSAGSMKIIYYWLKFVRKHFKRLIISFLKIKIFNILLSRIDLILRILLILFINACKMFVFYPFLCRSWSQHINNFKSYNSKEFLLQANWGFLLINRFSHWFAPEWLRNLWQYQLFREQLLHTLMHP